MELNPIEPGKIKIIIAENQCLIRKALKAFISYYHFLEFVDEACNGRELLDLLKNKTTDVVLLDIEMPVMDGYEALKKITTRFPKIKVIMLSNNSEIQSVDNCISLGAKAYLTKDCTEKQFERAIREVYKNGFYLEADTIQQLADLHYKTKIKTPGNGISALTGKEMKILVEICHGKTNKEIAGKLNISEHTVHFHRINIYKKTRCHNLADLMQYSFKQGLVKA